MGGSAKVTMDMEDFIRLSLDEQVVQLRGELGLLQALWAREGAFGRVWTRVLDLLISPSNRSDLDSSVRAVADATYLQLVTRPTDLLSLIDSQREERAIWLLRDYVRHRLARNDVICGLATMPALLARMPQDSGWLEVVVLVYGTRRLNAAPDRRFTIEDLIPLGVDTDRSTSRAVLASALDNNQLADSETERLLAMFPDDRHFRRVIKRQ